MCLNPQLIPNKNFGKKFTGVHKVTLYYTDDGVPIKGFRPTFDKVQPMNIFKDCSSAYIQVPCGHCEQCIALRQMAIVQRVQMESLDNWLFMASLTYDNAHLPVITTSNGYDLPYADVHHLTDMFKRLRKDNAFGRPFRVFYVSELGSKRGRPHFHVLFMLPRYETDSKYEGDNLESLMFSKVLSEWRVNTNHKRGVRGSASRNANWESLCQYRECFSRGKLRRTFDLHLLRPSLTSAGYADVAFYVTKYMLKPSTREIRLQQALKLNLSDDEYENIWSIVRSRWDSSLDFGNSKSPKVRDYIRHCIVDYRDKFPYPVYVSPDTGLTFPLCRFYKDRFFTYDDAMYLYMNNDNPRATLDTIAPLSDSLTNEEYATSIRKFNDRIKNVNIKNVFDFE